MGGGGGGACCTGSGIALVPVLEQAITKLQITQIRMLCSQLLQALALLRVEAAIRLALILVILGDGIHPVGGGAEVLGYAHANGTQFFGVLVQIAHALPLRGDLVAQLLVVGNGLGAAFPALPHKEAPHASDTRHHA